MGLRRLNEEADAVQAAKWQTEDQALPEKPLPQVIKSRWLS